MLFSFEGPKKDTQKRKGKSGVPKPESKLGEALFGKFHLMGIE